MGVRDIPIALAALVVLGVAAAPAQAATISSSTPTPLADDFTDNGVCSLREMVEIANTNNAAVENACTVDTNGGANPLGDDTIQLGAGIYPIQRNEDGTPDDNGQGDLDILDSAGTLTIVGQPGGTTTVSGGTAMPPNRVFHAYGGDLALQHLVVGGGHPIVNGGGIRSETGTALSLDDTSVTGNSAPQGGGISSAGDLVVANGSLIQGNSATTGYGGGIDAQGPSMAISDTTIAGNHADTAAVGGGGIYSAISSLAGAPTIANSVISGNTAGGFGGGLISGFSGDGTLTITGSAIKNNVASSGTGLPEGGGIDVATDNLSIFSSVISGNHAMHTASVTGAVGGGINSEGPGGPKVVRLTDSVVANNTAETTDDTGQTTGGGIYDADGDLQLRRTTVSGNSLSGPTAGGPQYGGGIFLGPSKGSLLLLNSTVANNLAPKTAVIPGRGAGIDVLDSSVGPQTTATIIHSTIAGNIAGDVGGGADPGDAIQEEGPLGAKVTVRGSIVAAPDVPAEGCSNGSGTIESGGRNVTTDPACFTSAGAGDAQGTDPQLGSLADNGGPAVGAPGQLQPLLTQALSPGTPAVDRVPAAECTNEVPAPLGADERGYPRPAPSGGACDSGAYELFICKGQPLNIQGPFDGCAQDTTASGTPPAAGAQPAAARKKCKKKKRKHSAAAAKKKCKKKKKK